MKKIAHLGVDYHLHSLTIAMMEEDSYKSTTEANDVTIPYSSVEFGTWRPDKNSFLEHILPFRKIKKC